MLVQEDSIINFENISFKISDKTLFSGFNESIKTNQSIGLLGENGSGKSSLLQIINQNNQPDSGQITFRKNIRISYLKQLDTSRISSDKTILEYLTELGENYWEVTELADKIFGLQIENYEKLISSLSGGEIMQLNLALVFSKNSDLLILDEPTNHLDIIALKQLENYLLKINCAKIIVSHNQQFIENICDKIWFIGSGIIDTFSGKLSGFNQNQIELMNKQKEDYKLGKSRLKTLEESAKREAEKSEKGKNSIRKKFLEGSYDSSQYGYFKNIGEKSTGLKAKQFKELKEEATNVIANLRFKEQPIILPKLATDKQQGSRKLIDVKNASLKLSNGKKLLEGLNLDISYGNRLALMGRNGSGKTSLIKAIIGDEDYLMVPSSTLKLNSSLEIRFLNQRYEIIDKNKTVLENILSYCPTLTKIEARHQLSNFKFFTILDVSKLGLDLSGGELARLAFAMITAIPIDLLILDEPTNNLDILVINQISSALKQFAGAILVISHDVKFLEDIGVESYLFIKNSGLVAGGIEDLDRLK